MGAKKKSLADRLAKMSDEDRAKYMQRKADIEEETRRRKEQLISTFMKNKIKKEEAFTRLNLAKINQYWHQLLRVAKNKEMKENVEHMRKWIERVITLKNKTISKLMDELDEAEEQYNNNFQTHMCHIDEIIETHTAHLEQLDLQYGNDHDLILETYDYERVHLREQSANEVERLKIITFAQNTEATRNYKADHERYLKTTDELVSIYKTELQQLQKSRDNISSAIWRQIAKVLRAYVEQTDPRRFHLAELHKLDANSANEITKNQDYIQIEEKRIEQLEKEYASMMERNETTLKRLTIDINSSTKDFFALRKRLHLNINDDEKRLRLLIETSNKTIQDLESLVSKGEHILQLAQNCRKLETQEEKVTRWARIVDDEAITNLHDYIKQDENGAQDGRRMRAVVDQAMCIQGYDVGETDATRFQKLDAQPLGVPQHVDYNEKSIKPQPYVDVSRKKSLEESEKKSAERLMEATPKSILPRRPKTSLPKRVQIYVSTRQFKSEDVFGVRPKSPQAVEELQPLPSLYEDFKQSTRLKGIKSAASTKSPQVLPKLVQRTFSHYTVPAPKTIFDGEPPVEYFDDYGFVNLHKLEGLWWVYNKVQLDCNEMKQAKKDLLAENKQLKEMLRGILAASALGKSIPSTKDSSAASNRRFVLSAPVACST